MAESITFVEKRECGHVLDSYPLSIGRVKVECPVCGQRADTIVFVVTRKN